MGVIIYYLIGGYPPFYSANEKESLGLTMTGRFEFHEDSWAHVSSGAKDIISNLLLTNPMDRATAKQSLDHPWIEEGDEVLGRITLDQCQKSIKRHLALTKLKGAANAVSISCFISGVSNAGFTLTSGVAATFR